MHDSWPSITRARVVQEASARVSRVPGSGLVSPSGSTAFLMVRARKSMDEFLLTTTVADDLPEIRKNIEQGFKETQQTVTKWISNFTKKLDGEVEEYDRYGNPQYTGRTGPPQQRQNFGPSQSDQMYGIRKSAEQRRSADHNRYDADNRVIGDDFAKLELRDNECE